MSFDMRSFDINIPCMTMSSLTRHHVAPGLSRYQVLISFQLAKSSPCVFVAVRMCNYLNDHDRLILEY